MQGSSRLEHEHGGHQNKCQKDQGEDQGHSTPGASSVPVPKLGADVGSPGLTLHPDEFFVCTARTRVRAALSMIVPRRPSCAK